MHVEWDRGHEEFDALIRAESGDGIIVSEFHDHSVRAGWKWIPTSEIVSIEPLPDSSPVVRIARIRSYPDLPIEVEFTRLEELLAYLASSAEIVGVFRAATGSDELLVGRIGGLVDSGFDLELVSTDGDWEDAEHHYELGEVISIEWGTEYLTAMGELAGPR